MKSVLSSTHADDVRIALKNYGLNEPSGLMSDISVKTVEGEYVKQLSTTPPNSLSQSQ